MNPQDKIQKIGLIVFEMVVFIFYVNLLIVNSFGIREPRTFFDSGDYLRIAAQPVFSMAFWTDNKPPVTALFYKLVESDPDRIFAFQLYFSIFSWGMLALVVAFTVKSYLLKPVAFVVILAFSLNRDIFMWAPLLVSESTTLSITALFIASALWLVTDWKPYKVFVLLVTAFLMAFSRDVSAYLLLMTVGALLPFLWLKTWRRNLLFIIASFLVIFIASITLANVNMRQYVNILSITAFRIFPNPEYVAFLKNFGMPVDESLVEQSHTSLTRSDSKYNVLKALYTDPKQEDYRKWVRKNGTQSYIRFLWFFKADALQKMFIENPQDVFYPDVYYYTASGYKPIIKDQRISEMLYPTRFGLLFFFLANIFAALLSGFAISKQKSFWLVPLLMIFFTYPQVFLVWNGDANEIARHSVEHNVMERLGFWILVLFVMDSLTESIQPIFKRFWTRIFPLRNNNSS